ncbi:tetratricopeptide repeat protein [Paenibacillus sp. Marseille-Q4541]|uniref:tetratricopeptide repeat protein n=1 Tax=Paenibacillus sp. Marseille-Q4541 TaxID=2831522 RepID=UPI001BA9A707|nr:tetratricopeptide repeat protein [Paenibacillus sp. Marseille-Q4541]
MDWLKKVVVLRDGGHSELALEELLRLEGLHQGGKVQIDSAQLNYQLAWTYDTLGLEKEAVPYYEAALTGTGELSKEDRAGVFLGLGSTYRTLGQYENSEKIFEIAMQEFPEKREFQVFMAMVQYNLKEYKKAMKLLLEEIAEHSSNEGVQKYKRAIAFYSDKLDERWD